MYNVHVHVSPLKDYMYMRKLHVSCHVVAVGDQDVSSYVSERGIDMEYESDGKTPVTCTYVHVHVHYTYRIVGNFCGVQIITDFAYTCRLESAKIKSWVWSLAARR